MTKQWQHGDEVVVDPDFPGARPEVLGIVYVVDRSGPKNTFANPKDGVGRGIRYPHESLLPATKANIAKTTTPRPFVAREFFTAGQVVTLKRANEEWEWDETTPLIVMQDKGNKVNVTLLGGAQGRYLRTAPSNLTVRDIDWLLESLADQDWQWEGA